MRDIRFANVTIVTSSGNPVVKQLKSLPGNVAGRKAQKATLIKHLRSTYSRLTPP